MVVPGTDILLPVEALIDPAKEQVDSSPKVSIMPLFGAVMHRLATKMTNGVHYWHQKCSKLETRELKIYRWRC